VAKLTTKKARIAPVDQLIAVNDLAMGLELRQSASLLQPGQARLLRN